MSAKKKLSNKNNLLFNAKIALSPLVFLISLYLILQTFTIAVADSEYLFPTPTFYCPDDICDVTPPPCDGGPTCQGLTPTSRVTEGQIETPTTRPISTPTIKPSEKPGEDLTSTEVLVASPTLGGGNGGIELPSMTPKATPTSTPQPTSSESKPGESSSSSTSSSTSSGSGGGGEVLGLAETGSFRESIATAFFILSVSFFGLTAFAHAKKKS
ncbi:hypothetical protein A3J15_00120 [Candidatus Roizmanbacteria bacterium RIFCSPLOWO2_02_FULL_38_10]|uniref:Uncharacterized protein n=1 Tax=Candidatus Roizmanbacteria bacterium RIFCSPLOWO2_02_FULL_38_10 TaxID=1802074 RepID=A0A1F7JNF0_9BACT|nr:MAG: hypothetical protein A3J15_00120 [Candidatus Roizmanbacteria bacterium RIFCSPLOWO2_02_FULL_38_10]